jgi:hypothetical protein
MSLGTIEFPTALRRFIYDELLSHGLPPSSEQIGDHFGVSADKARSAIGSLKIGKTVLPHPTTGEIWMAGPFAARPSVYRVVGSRLAWWANCAWDMLGVMVIVNEPVHVETECTDCRDPISIDATPEAGVLGPTAEMVVHFLVPARHWYDDIGFT